MPIYTFECTECKAVFEELVPSYKIEALECQCEKKSKAVKTMSPPAKPSFTGTGFYETDYKIK